MSTTTSASDRRSDKSNSDSFRKNVSRIKKLFKGTTGSSSSSSSVSSSRNSSRTSLNNIPTNPHNMNKTVPEDDDMPPLRPITLKGYTESTKNHIMTQGTAEEIRTLLPARLTVTSTWQLLYSLEQHGASLNSLYRILKDQKDKKIYDKNGYVLIIRDAHGGVFGAYVNEIFQPHELKRYYGNGECFLWSVEKVSSEAEFDHSNIRFKGFPFTGLNDYIIYCQFNSISIGSSEGHNGIWIDRNLMHGVTQRCDTFGNDVLSKEGEKFKIMGLEVWMV
ncbi:hypothetical protein WICPIJ_002640 [Wickerhamomyces pijperi]|uniref:Oxidation resistance protein 1 n=1 Tax=Wickerhamomyces pijperi TaxID=599730 RepID=A0A9P8Q8L8_WICPI|nr:hypothetical protein WICPIJ_002640 [Wickerhamomyces pijperi]